MLHRGATPFQRVRVRGLDVVVKRDDLFYLSGNKFRKLYWLVEKDAAYFNRTAQPTLSYGGLQSNAMLAIAQLAHLKRVPFTYFTKTIELQPETAPVATNFKLASNLGMRHVELSSSEYEALAESKDFGPLVTTPKWIGIPQGGASADAEVGVQVLASEINAFASDKPRCDPPLSVLLPSGTGTTAYYLAKHLRPDIDVYAVPCVGSAAYLQQQWQQLEPNGLVTRARMLSPKKRVAFGSLWKPLLAMHQELWLATQIEFDLVYACLAWHTLFHALETRSIDLNGRQLVYIHCGGTSGNPSQRQRYERKWPRP
ncbi:hypothetical protein SPRG_01151 [Saprolegnia parasitica CBS 223.65]|uniref:Tryptophan synthase beta chain-like PALP domain-containing protein n=1 Tax=Saprolegnia parasitica (strain CBS 223.65) TaxID=695850 RepID=A0A067D8W8_SAPPC|nr:hypothetical protein SPRG_01151 [Saprolegnia parasitica CBS 223.65]KDO35086.1 hypothetical protein SPRG_01151 [Saprolegnia parasitica CBS 223.65]|eukprot:XP_012194738.1 hypothetical protein SPRG_01151 [Saprolegnia parasitica CBS 223.65]